MINIVIDTTLLRNDPARKKAAFSSLKRLAQAGDIKLHVPHLVKEEFLSQQTEHYLAGLSEIRTLIAKFKKKHMPQEVREQFSNIDKQLLGFKEELVSFAGTDFDQWIAAVRAEIHPISESHGKKVMDAYFSGTLPFREKKRRDDIPDAFIWQAILDLVERFGEVYVVSGDGAIQAASEAHTAISCFRTLEEFIASDICQTPLRINLAKSNCKRLISIATQIVDQIKATIEAEAIGILDGKIVDSQQIPDDNNQATITLIGDPEDIEIFANDAEYFGQGLFVIPVTFSSECLLNYVIYMSDFYSLPNEKAEQISISELNDHYFDAEEYYNLSVLGYVALNFGSLALESEDVSDEQLLVLAEKVDINLDSVETIEVPS